MRIFDWLKNKRSATVGNDFLEHIRNHNITLGGNSMQLSAVYRCVDVISDAVASLPLRLFEIDAAGKKKCACNNGLSWVLNEEPDDRLTRFTFFKTMVAEILLKGNAFAVVDRSKKIPRMLYVRSDRVTLIPCYDANGNKYFVYQILGYDRALESKEVIHLMNFSYDGLAGISVLDHAKNTLLISKGGEQQAADFFSGSGQPSGVLTVEGSRLNDTQREGIYSSWENRIKNKKGGIAVLEGNMKYQSVSLNPSDAQLLESRQFSVIEICRFFGVSPVKCFDLSNSSYSTVEATQLSFLTDTIAPILEKIELELKRKLFLDNEKANHEIKFDTSVLLRADKAAQANYYRTMVNIGCMTPNEVRGLADLEAIDGGDVAYIQTNMTQINKLGQENEEKKF